MYNISTIEHHSGSHDLLAFKDKGKGLQKKRQKEKHRIKLILLSLETHQHLSYCQTIKQTSKGCLFAPWVHLYWKSFCS